MKLKKFCISAALAFSTMSASAQDNAPVRQPEEILCDMSDYLPYAFVKKNSDGYFLHSQIGPMWNHGIPVDELYNRAFAFIERAENDRSFPRYNALGQSREEMIEVERTIGLLGQELASSLQNIPDLADVIHPQCGGLLLSSHGSPLGFILKT
jgi:hypothetical protein